jgi:hypothetical protein
MRTQLQRRGEVLYVTGNRLAWKQRARGALHEGGVVIFFFFFFFFFSIIRGVDDRKAHT